MAMDDYELDYITEDGWKHYKKVKGRKGRGFFVRSALDHPDGTTTLFKDMTPEQLADTKARIAHKLASEELKLIARKAGVDIHIYGYKEEVPEDRKDHVLCAKVNPFWEWGKEKEDGTITKAAEIYKPEKLGL